jgi:hypothetical protein
MVEHDINRVHRLESEKLRKKQANVLVEKIQRTTGKMMNRSRGNGQSSWTRGLE